MHHFFTASLLLHIEMCAISPIALHVINKGMIPGLPINLDSYLCITFLPPPFFCMLKCVQFLQELTYHKKMNGILFLTQQSVGFNLFIYFVFILSGEFSQICDKKKI
jgi:hypothetical protein